MKLKIERKNEGKVILVRPMTKYYLKKLKLIEKVIFFYEYKISPAQRKELERIIRESGHVNKVEAAKKMMIEGNCHQNTGVGDWTDIFSSVEETISVGVFFLGSLDASLREVSVVLKNGRAIKIPFSKYNSFNYELGNKKIKHVIQKRMTAFNAGLRQV